MYGVVLMPKLVENEAIILGVVFDTIVGAWFHAEILAS